MQTFFTRVAHVAVAVALGSGVGFAGEPPPKDLDALGRMLDGLEPRLTAFGEWVAQDERVALVQAYTSQDFKNPKRPQKVKAIEILDKVMFDPTAAPDLRRSALMALTSIHANSSDPDLVVELRQKKPRAQFSILNVTEHLDDDDLLSRQLADKFLVAMHGRPPGLIYDAENGTKAQWKLAKSVWERHLRRS